MENIAFLFIAGGLGSLGRYGLNVLSRTCFGTALWGTVAVNLLGSLLFGLLWSLAHEAKHPWFVGRNGVVLMVGFLGAFTTFSTFAFEAHAMLRRGQLLACGGYVLLQNTLGLLGVATGIYLGRLLYD